MLQTSRIFSGIVLLLHQIYHLQKTENYFSLMLINNFFTENTRTNKRIQYNLIILIEEFALLEQCS